MGQESELVILLWQMGSNGLESEVGLDYNTERSALSGLCLPATSPGFYNFTKQQHDLGTTRSNA